MPSDDTEDSRSLWTRPSAPDSFSLALETSGRVGSVALLRGDELLAERTYPHGLQHASALVPLLDELFREQGLAPHQATEIYVSIGPGSFTGLRVGVTLAKALAYATGARIVAVPSVRVLAENAPADAGRVLIVLDAKRGQIFTATFDRTAAGDWSEREPARLDRLADVLARTRRPVHLIGEGIAFHRDAIVDNDGVVIVDEAQWQPRASVVARLGRRMAAAGTFTDAFQLRPLYVRLPEAEEKRLIAEGVLGADGTERKESP